MARGVAVSRHKKEVDSRWVRATFLINFARLIVELLDLRK